MKDPAAKKMMTRLAALPGYILEADAAAIQAPIKKLVLLTVRFFMIMARKMTKDEVWQRAASLTYTTILSLFPLIIVMTSLGSAFYTPEEEERLIAYVEQRLLPPQDPGILTAAEREDREEKTQEIEGLVSGIRDMSSKFRQSAPQLGFVGFVGLLITAFFLYRSVESTFEVAWDTGATKRRIQRTIAGFTLMVIMAPAVLTASATVSTFFVTQSSPTPAEEVVTSLPVMMSAPVAPVVPAEPAGQSPRVTFSDRLGQQGMNLAKVVVTVLPWLLNSLMLALAYLVIPHERVKFTNALIGGLTAGALWELAKIGFFYYIYMSAVRRELVASLGALPIFLIWIYVTWVVFLLGNHITFVTQNFRRLYREQFMKKPRTTWDGQIFVTMALLVADAFRRGERGISKEDLADRLRVPIEEYEGIVRELRRAGIVTMTAEGRLIPARPPESVTVREILDMGCDPFALCDPNELVNRPQVRGALQAFQGRVESLDTTTLGDLLDIAPKDESAAGEEEANGSEEAVTAG